MLTRLLDTLYVLEITSGSFEKATSEVNPQSGASNNNSGPAARTAPDLDTESYFYSAGRGSLVNVPHTGNNRARSGVKKRRTRQHNPQSERMVVTWVVLV
jgi:hypothetical protein